MKKIILSLLLCFSLVTSAQGGAPKKINAGKLIRQFIPKNVKNATTRDTQTQATTNPEEYRGYNGRTLIQAYYACRADTFRAATPGDSSKGILEKIRIRMYVMDTCMNREGFFRNNKLVTPFNTNAVVLEDFVY
jgi:hypothetical protein